MRALVAITVLVLIFTKIQAQYVSTFFDSTGIKITDDLIFDSKGNLFGADYSGNSVYKITPSGAVSTFTTGFNAPNGMAFDSMGNMFVCDNTGDQVYKISVSGSRLDSVFIQSPSGIIKQEGSDTMIFTTYVGNKLVKLAPNGSMTTWFSGAPLNGPVGLVYDDSGNLYVGNFTDRKIYEVGEDSLIYIAMVPGTTGSSLGFLAYANDCLWGTNFQNHQIHRVYLGYTDSVVLYAGTTFGSVDGPLSSAKFYQPNGIVAKGDSLYISEYATGNIRLISGISLNVADPELSNHDFSISPNPVIDRMSLLIKSGNENRAWNVKDAQGRVVMKGQTESSAETISVEQLSPGLYFLSIESKMGKERAIKFLKS